MVDEFDIKKWKEKEVYSTYLIVKEKLDSVDRQINEAKEVVAGLEKIREQYWKQVQELKKILIEEFNHPII